MPIENRNLKPGDKLVSHYHKQAHTCQVIEGEGGKLRYCLQDGREFNSPSAAGMAITGKACNGWAFWSVETASVAASTPPADRALAETRQPAAEGTSSEATQEAPATATVAAQPPEQPEAAKKSFSRTPNQRGVPESQTRWFCPECHKSFIAAGTEAPETCPQGHKPG